MPDIADNLPRSARRVLEAAQTLGIAVELAEMPASTRTAEEAAAACKAEVAQIVKSLIFRGEMSGSPYLLLVSGSNRVDQGKVAADLGETLGRPDADFVRKVTGYAIGGVPPFGHAQPLKTFMDRDLLAFSSVWAAAGTPRTIMRLDPGALRDATKAEVISVA